MGYFLCQLGRSFKLITKDTLAALPRTTTNFSGALMMMMIGVLGRVNC